MQQPKIRRVETTECHIAKIPIDIHHQIGSYLDAGDLTLMSTDAIGPMFQAMIDECIRSRGVLYNQMSTLSLMYRDLGVCSICFGTVFSCGDSGVYAHDNCLTKKMRRIGVTSDGHFVISPGHNFNGVTVNVFGGNDVLVKSGKHDADSVFSKLGFESEFKRFKRSERYNNVFGDSIERISLHKKIVMNREIQYKSPTVPFCGRPESVYALYKLFILDEIETYEHINDMNIASFRKLLIEFNNSAVRFFRLNIRKKLIIADGYNTRHWTSTFKYVNTHSELQYLVMDIINDSANVSSTTRSLHTIEQLFTDAMVSCNKSRVSSKLYYCVHDNLQNRSVACSLYNSYREFILELRAMENLKDEFIDTIANSFGDINGKALEEALASVLTRIIARFEEVHARYPEPEGDEMLSPESQRRLHAELYDVTHILQ